MVSGTYEIMMKTPMGVKKGQMIMNEDGEKTFRSIRNQGQG